MKLCVSKRGILIKCHFYPETPVPPYSVEDYVAENYRRATGKSMVRGNSENTEITTVAKESRKKKHERGLSGKSVSIVSLNST